MALLKETFISLLYKYSAPENHAEKLWGEVEKNYSGSRRHYHTLKHLEHLLSQILSLKDQIKSRDVILFSLYYHDIVYNPLKSDNEEKSAELAEKRMKELSLSADMISLCKSQILATKSHVHVESQDTNYFTDADLSILGEAWDDYESYYRNIRKEYAIYPDLIYNPGRKKVLKQFLSMDRIFKTGIFYNKLETQARQNLERELKLLS